MKRVLKGEYGYINYMRKASFIKPLIMLGISLSILLAGWLYTGSRSNIMTVVAVLGVMPACKWLVTAIMFIRFHSRSESFYNKSIEILNRQEISSEYYFYDSVLTIEKGGSYPYNLFVCLNGSLIGYTDFEKPEISMIEKHLRSMLKNNNIQKIGVKLYTNEELFINRLIELAGKKDDNSSEADAEAIALIGALSL